MRRISLIILMFSVFCMSFFRMEQASRVGCENVEMLKLRKILQIKVMETLWNLNCGPGTVYRTI
jgi:hypothetical protein